MVERRGRVVKAYPKPAHPMQQSRSAYLLSIRLEQHGLLSTPPAYVHLELKKCFGFLELEVDHVIGFGKALRSTLRNPIASPKVLRRALARRTDGADGNRVIIGI